MSKRRGCLHSCFCICLLAGVESGRSFLSAAAAWTVREGEKEHECTIATEREKEREREGGRLCSLHRGILPLIFIPDADSSQESPSLRLKCQSLLAVPSSLITHPFPLLTPACETQARRRFPAPLQPIEVAVGGENSIWMTLDFVLAEDIKIFLLYCILLTCSNLWTMTNTNTGGNHVIGEVRTSLPLPLSVP